ncbi:MAG: hypothetical protein KUG77_19645 [Nannocystaceae bacterium]|nr:hypothetical protein [Nannocystaceae bacterium]
MRTWTPLLVFSGLLLACDSGNAAAGGSTGIDPSTSNPGTSSSTSTTTMSPETGSFSGSGAITTEPGVEDDGEEPPEPPITFDIGETPDFGEFDDGCNAVDFLFVIDNSGSMFGAQTNLVANFPAFINGIQDTLVDVDSYHVGVAPTDDHNGFTPSNPVECRQLGALITTTAGADSSNTACGPYTEGFSYITEQDDLSTSFQCAARVGTSGDAGERPMNTVEAAIGPDLNAEGACNEGFIRDHALLVVVVITDEADGPGDPDTVTSTGDPASWYQSVLDAKGGIAENAAALVLTNYVDGPCPPGGFGSDDGVNLVDFAGLFGENGFVGGICEPDYGPSFTQATAVIQQACENFIPPG